MRNTRLLITLCIVCVAVFAAGLYLPWHFVARSNEFGDTAGAINGLFSALAFAGVIYAILQQRRDLNRQRDALRRMRSEQRPLPVDRETQAAILLSVDFHLRLARIRADLRRLLEESDAHSAEVRRELHALQARADAIHAGQMQLIADCKDMGVDVEELIRERGVEGERI